MKRRSKTKLAIARAFQTWVNWEYTGKAENGQINVNVQKIIDSIERAAFEAGYRAGKKDAPK